MERRPKNMIANPNVKIFERYSKVMLANLKEENGDEASRPNVVKPKGKN
jgi:hypothetical protein